MRESKEIKIKTFLVKYFKTNFSYFGMNDVDKEARVYKLFDDMFLFINSIENSGPEKLPTQKS